MNSRIIKTFNEWWEEEKVRLSGHTQHSLAKESYIAGMKFILNIIETEYNLIGEKDGDILSKV